MERRFVFDNNDRSPHSTSSTTNNVEKTNEAIIDLFDQEVQQERIRRDDIEVENMH